MAAGDEISRTRGIRTVDDPTQSTESVNKRALEIVQRIRDKLTGGIFFIKILY